MPKLTDMPKTAQLGVVFFVLVAASAALNYFYFKPIADVNKSDAIKRDAKRKEVETLRPYEKNLPELDRQIVALKQQMDIQKHIVPDEKDADEFIHMMHNTAAASGIEIRKYKADAGASREYFVEVPFAIELDGPYYSMLNFFEKVAKLERIINISNLQLAAIKGKGSYQYSPNESVFATCTATTIV